MEDKRFDQPVRVRKADTVGDISVPIWTVAEAAQQLLERHDWPASAARNHLRARKACLDVLQGIREAREARTAFEAVAKDAGILRPPATIPAPIEGYRTTNWKGRRKLKRDM